jgi:hypothetical protein
MKVGDVYYLNNKPHGGFYIVQITDIEESVILGIHLVDSPGTAVPGNLFNTVGRWDRWFFEREYKKATKLMRYLYE